MQVILRIIAILSLVSLLMSCVSNVGKDFCLASGHVEDSPAFKSCQAKYQGQRDLYQYCQENQGIFSEGPRLQQCLNKATQVKNRYLADKGSCDARVAGKYYPGMVNNRLEEQTVITPDFRTATTLVQLSDPVDYNVVNGARSNYMQQCLDIMGWPGGNWTQNKRSVSNVQIANGLKQLDGQNMISTVAGNRNITLLHKAAAEGNLQVLSNILDSRQANIEDVNHQGYTALHFAAVNGQLGMVRHLIEIYHANLDARGKNGMSVIDVAVKSRNNELVNYLYTRQQQNALMQAQSNAVSTGNWQYVGCFKDKEQRSLPEAFVENKLMTNQFCQSHCAGAGFSYAGTQFGSQCFCSNSEPFYSRKGDQECNMPCSGNAGEKCGSSWRNSVWRRTM